MENILKAITGSGIQLTAEQITTIGTEAKEKFNLSDNMLDELKLALLSTTKVFQDHILTHL